MTTHLLRAVAGRWVGNRLGRQDRRAIKRSPKSLLTRHGVIKRIDSEAASRRYAYELTEKGLAWKPVLLTYADWIHEHQCGFNGRIIN
ncbi:winged helix-turn-helix transcriptional regulator [Granulosicoccus antarcticus]|uniref:winged helix-turn-helix transcriptional regulator n=1 Tax=Granulosicoccus antarcticus TaxID=437505 RepID=UPI003AB0616D